VTNLRPAVIACAGLTTVGVNVAMRGALLPYILDDLHLSYTIGGTFGMLAAAAYLSTTMFSGYLADRYGTRRTLLIGLAVGGGSMLLFSGASLVGLLCFLMFINGSGNAFVEISSNKIITDNYAQHRARFMNLLHFFFGAGALIAPLIAGMLLAGGMSWRVTLALTALGGLAVWVLDMRLGIRHQANHAGPPHPRQFLNVFRDRRVQPVLLLIMLHTGAEMGIAAWLVNYLQAHHGLATIASTFALSMMFVGLTGGRLLAAVSARVVGHPAMPAVAGLLSVGSIGAGMWSGDLVIPAFLLCGLSFSIIFPLLATVSTELSSESAGVVLGAYCFCGGIGASAHIWWMGLLNDMWGVQAGFASVLAIKVLFTLVALWLWRQRKKGITT
jgi:fucose permease